MKDIPFVILNFKLLQKADVLFFEAYFFVLFLLITDVSTNFVYT